MDLFIRKTSGPVRRNGALSAAERSDSSWANSRAFAAISTDGQVRAWGDPASGGQLPGPLAPLLTRQSDTPWIWTVELASSTAAFAARRANGQVVAWGDAASGGAIPEGLETALNTGVVRLYGLGRSFVALKANGTVIHWGNSGSGVSELSGLDLSQPYQVVTSFDSLAILQNGRVLGCWGGFAGGQQWSQHSDLRSALAGDVLQLVGSDTGFAARTASGQVMTWGAPQGTGDVGMSITSRPDIVELCGDADGFHGFTAKGQIRAWGVLNGQYQAGENLLKEPNQPSVPIISAVHFFRAPGGGFGWVDDIGVLQLYQYRPSLKQQFIPDVDIKIDQNPFQGTNGLAVIDQGGDLQTLGYQLEQTNKPDLASPNPVGFFSPSNNSSSAYWQTVRASGGGAFAALASNGQIGLWGDPNTGASPANPELMQRLLDKHPATRLYSNAGAFVALSENGTAISWGNAATGGDRNGSPLIVSGIDHLVSPWEGVRIDDLGTGLLSLIANGKPNPDGQSSPLRVQEGDRLSVVISGDPNGDRSDTSGNQYLWQRDGKANGAGNQASINLDALSTGTWSVTPTYLDLPGFSRTLAPLNVQVQMVDNGPATLQIRPYTFSGPADQAFSAGNGKMAELLATLAGDPEGISSIEGVQWYRDGVPIGSAGSPDRSILVALEPGNYSFEATYTDTQGYRTTLRSGRIQIDAAGSVPSQSRIATGGLQTLWQLESDGGVQRFDSRSLRMRAVERDGTSGYLAISAASDGSAWALDNDGVACVYDDASNRFIRLDGSKQGDANQPDTTRPDLGRGWRQIVAARGSNTAPALWLLKDAPLNGGSNVAYVPGALAKGQTLADLKPVSLNGAPALRLLAVGDDQNPWGLDDDGNLWRWDAGSEGFVLLAAGVGSHIHQLQMIDQGLVWGLDDKGVLQMWDGERQIFKPVPLDSPFFRRRSELLTPGVTPTWESFSLSQLGGFAGIPRSGVTLPAGGNGLVCFDTSEIAMLRDPSENPSQLQLLGGETLQDNGVRQVGQNLAFNLNNQVNVAYMLNSSRPGQWEGAAVVPKAQSGADLTLEPGPNRDNKGSRLPVLKLRWLSGLGNDGQQAYGSRGYVSPFGGLVFEEAALEQETRALRAGLLSSTFGLPLASSVSNAAATWNAGEPTTAADQNLGSTTRVPIEWNSELAFVLPNIDGKTIPGWLQKVFNLTDGKGNSAWKAKGIFRFRLGGFSQPGKTTQIQTRGDFRYEISRDIQKDLSPGSFTREKPDFVEFNKKAAADSQKEPSRLNRLPYNFEGQPLNKKLNSQYGFYIYTQIDTRWNIGGDLITEFTNPERFAVAAGTEFRLIIPIKSWANGSLQLSMTLGGTVDYYGLWQQRKNSSTSNTSPKATQGDATSPDSFITFIDSRDQSPATSETPKEYLVALVDSSQIPGLEVISSLEEVTPAVDLITDVIIPIAKTVLAVFLPGGDINTTANPSLNPGEALLLAAATSTTPDTPPSPTTADPQQQASLAQLAPREAQTPVEALGSFPPLAKQGARLRPYVGGLLRFQSVIADASLHARVIPYFSFFYDYNKEGWVFQVEKTIVRLDMEFAFVAWVTFRERLNIEIPGASTPPIPLASNLGSASVLREEAAKSWVESSITPSRNLNTHLTADSRGSVTPIAELIPTRRNTDTLLPGQQLMAGEYLLSANGQYMVIMQTDGNLVVQASYANGMWAQSFTLNDYRDRNGKQASVAAGTTLELRNGQLKFVYANGDTFALDGGTYQRGWDVPNRAYYKHAVTTNPLPNGTSLSELRLTNDGVLEARASDGSKVFGFDRYYEETPTNELATKPIPSDRLSGFVSLQRRPIGIATRLLPGNTGLFELVWVRGTLQSDGLTIHWDPSSARAIQGSEGYTSDVKLIELGDGRLAVSGSHIAAADPLLQPITQLPPGTLYHLRSDQVAPGGTTVLDGSIAQKGLPSDRIWAQLGSSLASSSRLRSDWIGDSLIAGASGTNHGAGAIYIINGLAVSSLDDLSILEDNSRAGQGGWGLVILGSHKSGSLSGLGQQVINGGDTNADGFNEIFASAPQDQSGAGLVYMLYGGKALELLPQVAAGSITLDTLDALQTNPNTRNQFLQSFTGVSGTSAYGTILAGGVDLNGDGHADPLIGYAATNTSAGSVELWSSRRALQQQNVLGLDHTGQQAIPHFDRSLLVSARTAEASQSDFHIYGAASVGDLNGDGHGDIVLSSDSRAALVFGDALMPVYWEASSVLGSIAVTRDPNTASPLSQTWTSSWVDGAGTRVVLSFAGADRNNDGRITTVSLEGATAEVDWLALRRDGDPSDPKASLVALSPQIAQHWSGALQISAADLSFDLARQSFSAPVSISADQINGDAAFNWSSDEAGLSLEQGARSLNARLLSSNAPGVLNAAGIGDFNGDGRPDLALSQAGVRVPNGEGTALVRRSGQTAVVFGSPTLSSRSGPLPLEAVTAVGGPAGLLLGDSGGELSAIGDWNRDGKADLLIREPAAPGASGTDQAGSNVALFGRADSSPTLQLTSELQASRAQILQGSASGSLTGASAAAGDFAGGGKRSLLIGAPNTIRESDLRQAAAGVRVLTATQNADGSWQSPQQLPSFSGAASGQQQLSSYTAVGNRILATWVHARASASGEGTDELWAALQDPLTGTWTPAHKLQSNRRGDPTSPSIGEVQALALSDANGQATGGVLLVWTTLDPITGRTFLFQSTYNQQLPEEAHRWSTPAQQDPDALLLANQDAISGSQLKLQLNPSGPAQRSQIWAEAGASSEGDASAVINVRRSGDLSQPLMLNYATRDLSASAGSQYQHSEGTVAFAAGESSIPLAIELLDNGNLEYRNTAFAVDFSLPSDHLAAAQAQLLLSNTPVTSASGLAILSVSAAVQDNETIRMRAIDAGISLLGPLTGSTGEAAAASTASSLNHTIALVADPGADEGLGQVYALFVAATVSSAANPGMDWKELNDIQSLDEPVAASQGDGRQLNVLIQPEAALAALDGRAGFGTAMVKLRLDRKDYFAISAPGNPLDGTKPGRVYVVAATTIEIWANDRQTAKQPLILTDSNSLIIEQMAGGLFGSTLAAADLNADSSDELIIGAPGSSSVVVIDGTTLSRELTGRPSVGSLNPTVISDPNSTTESGSTAFGTAITAIDLDHDGNTDLAIGAPKALPVRATSVFDNEGAIVANAGAVYVVKGTSNLDAFQGDVESLVRAKTALILKGQAQVNDRGNEDDPPRPVSEGLPAPGSFGFGEELGSALAALDLNSDGIADLAIGAPQFTPDGTLRTGRVVTWFGNSPPRWGEAIDLGSVSAEAGVTFVGQQGGGRVGASLAAAGDLQRDNNQDLAIGAPFEDGGAGRVYVAFGSRNRYGREALKTTGNRFDLDATSPDSPFQTFEAPAGYQLGHSVVGLGDVNNDFNTGIGGDDLFLGSPNAVAPRTLTNEAGDIQLEPAGQTHLTWGRPWHGPNQSLDVPFTQGVGYLLPFGGRPMGLGDLNGDGYGDYALLGSTADAGGATAPADATSLRIRFGAAVEYEQSQVLLSTFKLRPAGSPLASDSYPLVAAGDFDGDGFSDLAALTEAGLKTISGAPNLSVQGDSQGHWDASGKTFAVSGTDAPISLMTSGDFDGDGYKDLIIVNQGSTPNSANPTLSIFWGSAGGLQAGASKRLSTKTLLPAIDALTAIDSNGDGIDELALYGNDLAPSWTATATGGWGLQLIGLDRSLTNPLDRVVSSRPLETGLNGVPTAMSKGDLDGDGLGDLLLDHGGNRIDVLLGQTDFRFKDGPQFKRLQASAGSISRTQLARFIGDWNGDGRDDLLFSPTSTQDYSAPPTYKYGPYNFVYLGTASEPKAPITVPKFWDLGDNNTDPRNLSSWAAYGFSIESLPGEADPYQTGGLGDVNGDGFDELLFSSNRLVVNNTVQPSRPHSVAIYGSNRLTPSALASTASNDGSSSDDTLHQLGSAGKQDLLLRGKAGSDLLQVHADPYGATLSIPESGENAGRLTVSASSGTTLWSQPRNAYELVLEDGQLQIIRTSDGAAIKTWGGQSNSIDRVYLGKDGYLYFLKAGVNDDQFGNPNGRNDLMSNARDSLDTNKGILGLAGWFENSGLFGEGEAPTQVGDSELIFNPALGSLYLVNRQAKSNNGDKDRDNWVFNGLNGYYDDLSRKGPTSDLDGGKTRRAYITLFNGDQSLDKRSSQATQILKPGESLFNATGAQKLGVSRTIESMDALQTSRKDLQTFVGQPQASELPFGIQRTTPSRHDRSLADIFGGTAMQGALDDIAWAASPVQQAGPYVAVMDGNGRLTINAQQLMDGQIKPGSELQVLHSGNPDPFQPPTGSEPVLIRPNTPTDQVSQSISRSTNNDFSAVLKGGLDDDRLGIDSLARFRNRDGQPAGLVDGGPGVDTLFFSRQRSDLQDPTINLVGFGSRIRDIEAIEIPINNTLEIDEALLLNTPLHRLKLESRGSATATFHVRTPYVLIGDQLDAGLAYSVYERPGSNLQLWVQRGRVSLNQQTNASGSSASVQSHFAAGQGVLTAGDPIDADQLAVNPVYTYRWYRDGRLIPGATGTSYGEAPGETLQAGVYVKQTDYTDRYGLRQTVASAPIQVDAAEAVTGGSTQVLRTSLDANQLRLLRSRTPGLEPGAELVQLLLTGPPATQRIALANSGSGSGLVALLDPGQTSPEAVREAGVYDFNNDASLDTLIWQPEGTTASGASLQTALMQGGRADLAVLANGNLHFVIQDPTLSARNLEVATLQSMRVSLLAAPAQGGAVLAIALEKGEILADLSKAERSRRAITLLSHQDADPAPLASKADRDRQLWLRADQELVLLELAGTAPSDWDGSLTVVRSLSPVQTLPASGIAGARLQLGSGSGLQIELEAQAKPQDLNSVVARSQTQAPVLDFRGLAGLTMEANIEVAREAAFTSVVGFYAIDNLDGSIRDPLSGALIAPGDSAYGSLAFANRSLDLVGFSSVNRTSTSTSLNLSESRLLAPYASVADPNRGLQTFYAFPAANPYGVNHFKSFGNGVIGLEDQAGGGDLDYDDILIHLKLSPIPI